MPIRFFCPGCHKPLSIGTRIAGTTIACPLCTHAAIVPTESAAHETVTTSAPVTGVRCRYLLIVAVPAVAFVLSVMMVAVAVVMFCDTVSGPVLAVATPTPPDSDEAPALPGGDAGLAELDLDTPPVVLPPIRPDAPTAEPATARETAPAAPSALLPAEAPKAPRPMLANDLGNLEDVFAPAPRPDPKPRPPDLLTARLQAKRRSHLTDQQLRKQLFQATTAGLERVPGGTKSLLAGSRQTAGTGLDLAPALMAQRPDLFGLRPRTGIAARISKEEALTLQVLSQVLRGHVEASMPGIGKGVVDLRPDADMLRKRLFNPQTQGVWLKADAIPTLRQLLMHEDRNARLMLVEALARMPNPQASVELAQRALFDLHPDVRGAALLALKGRRIHEFEEVLVQALRYPWPAIAEHAAEALVALDLRDMVPKLLALLDAKEMGEPFTLEWGGKRLAVVTELVRVNHHHNCLLCHARSHSPGDPLRKEVPNVHERIPLPASKGSYQKSGSVNVYVRADITYLRQDFSVLQPVANHGPHWPAEQRFDYLLRLWPLNEQQLQLAYDRLKDFALASPQREALLFVLRELTGQDAGPSVEDWRRVYSTVTGKRLEKPLEPADRMLYLRDALVSARPLRQFELLTAYKDRAGPDYDNALALAIPRIKGDPQKVARSVLADRLCCLTAQDLQVRLDDKNIEIRVAAATACARRGERTSIPKLIDLLADDSTDVARQAHLSLTDLARRDFGPRRLSDADGVRRAIASWREWWDEQERKAANRKGAP
jgi:hypothetical protein